MMYILRIVALCIVHFIFVSIVTIFVKYKKAGYENTRISPVISKFGLRSLTDCASMCTQTETCIAFGFNGNTSSCELSRYNPNDQLVSTVSENGWLIYITRPEKCGPSGYSGFVRDGMCYFWIQSQLTVSWATGRGDCRAHGAELACRESEAENAALVAAVPMWLWWFGLNDIEEEGTFMCNDTNVTYCKWGKNEPGSVDDCGAVWGNTTHQWYNAKCSVSLAYVCEMSWY